MKLKSYIFKQSLCRKILDLKMMFPPVVIMLTRKGVLLAFNELICCYEFENDLLEYINEHTKCIAHHPDIDTICLCPVILLKP